MTFSLRDIDRAVVAVIDERAKKNGKSRNTYLKELIHAHAALSAVDDSLDKYERLVQILLAALNQNTDVLTRVAELVDERRSPSE